jgi:hypothetical protein
MEMGMSDVSGNENGSGSGIEKGIASKVQTRREKLKFNKRRNVSITSIDTVMVIITHTIRIRSPAHEDSMLPSQSSLLVIK